MLFWHFLSMGQISKAKQKKIIDLMFDGETTYRISKELKISWATANKYVLMYQPIKDEFEKHLYNEISDRLENPPNLWSRLASKVHQSYRTKD